jgi:hypothetical protein
LAYLKVEETRKVMGKDHLEHPNALQILQEIKRSPDVQRQVVAGGSLDPRLALLRQWQSERLARTYADFLADERYRPACQFFLSEVYAPRDFSQRDHDIDHLYKLLSRLLPDSALRLLVDTIKLNNMTRALDNTLLSVLVERLGVTDSLSSQQYAQAYRMCDNYQERVDQIELVTSLIRQLDSGARLPLASLVLRAAGGPAHRAGWGEPYDLLMHGYAAFKRMPDVKPFVHAVEQRERRILDRVFAGDGRYDQKCYGI